MEHPELLIAITEKAFGLHTSTTNPERRGNSEG
jgi:hypothetical protein